jgi:hypothetical protein
LLTIQNQSQQEQNTPGLHCLSGREKKILTREMNSCETRGHNRHHRLHSTPLSSFLVIFPQTSIPSRNQSTPHREGVGDEHWAWLSLGKAFWTCSQPYLVVDELKKKETDAAANEVPGWVDGSLLPHWFTDHHYLNLLDYSLCCEEERTLHLSLG